MNSFNNIYFIVIASVIIALNNLMDTEAAFTIEQIHKMMGPVGKNCAAKSGLSPELQEAHKNRKFPPERELMCYLYCLEKFGKVIDKNDKIDVNTGIKNAKMGLPEQDMIDSSIKAFVDCLPRVTSEEPCEMAYQYAVCYYEISPETYFYP